MRARASWRCSSESTRGACSCSTKLRPTHPSPQPPLHSILATPFVTLTGLPGKEGEERGERGTKWSTEGVEDNGKRGQRECGSEGVGKRESWGQRGVDGDLAC